MTIALVVTNLNGGGAERVMLRLAATLGTRGHAVRVILLEHLIEHEVPAGVEVHALTAPGVPIGKGNLGVIRAAFALRRLYRRLGLLGRASATLSTLPFADRVVATARIPNVWFSIMNTQSLEAQALPSPRRRARRLARYRRLYEGRNLVAISDGVAADLRGPIGLERARIVRIYNGVDTAWIAERAAEPEPDLPREPFIVHASRFAAQKRHDLLLDAWRIAGLPHRLVLLTGTDPRLEAMIAARGLADRVTIAGFRPNPHPWIRAAELLVLCSDREGLGNVLVEALASGTRVVSTDCPSGPREVLTGDLARDLVPCGDAPALAAAMRAALARPRPSPGIPDAFTEAHMVDAYERVLTGADDADSDRDCRARADHTDPSPRCAQSGGPGRPPGLHHETRERCRHAADDAIRQLSEAGQEACGPRTDCQADDIRRAVLRRKGSEPVTGPRLTMCGILALIGTPWQASARAALATLRSRGPDAQAFWEQDGAVLGHARLSIIDVAGGAQPMTSADGRFVLVHNGEIYNFLDLRRELEERGHVFRTRSDTEVVLAGFAEWDRGLLDRLDGMFAFAIWDVRERRLFAARDRLGIKPLFWSSHNGIALASTLAPFFALDGFPRDADAEAIRDYLAFQAALAPKSFLRAVRQLPPAHLLDWRPGTLAHVERWWDLPEPPRTDAAARPAGLAELDSILRKAVSDQLVADVPLGAFLSGGIDSSLVVHYMAEAGARPIKTFSVRFAEAKYDESEAAASVARRYGTDHQVIAAPAMGAAEFAAAIEAMDQPMADPALVPTVELARQTRRHVTVALSGDGGDELFGGYERFLDTEDLHPPTVARRALRIAIDAGLLPGALLRRSLSGQELLLYRRVELGPWRRSRKSLASYLVPEAVAAFRPEATLARWIDLARSFGGRMDTAALMRADLWTYLSEDGLVKSDRAGMAHGLEIRVPLLGNRVADFALAQPAATHVRPEPKALLRALAREKLPNEVWMRKKHGFSVPLQASFNGPWRDFCEHAIGRIRDVAPFLRHAVVSKLWQGALSGSASRRLAYTFVVLSAWLERNPLSYDGVMDRGDR